jgi:hypothetical protein
MGSASIDSASPDKQPPELPGYRYLEHIGSGGNAEVFLYEQERPRRNVAVKVLNAAGLTDAVRQQFTAEANAMAGLADHPNIASVLTADIAPDGRPYLVMQYYPQANLGVRARRQQFSVADVLRIGVQISGAVETSHRGGTLHRDIKPHNILTDKFGAPALTDFGLATMKGASGAEGLSVQWSPPEVVYATSDADERSDVYSLGATLWHLLAGRPPFERPGEDNSTYAVMRRIQADDPPRTGREDVPESLERLLRQAMAKNPDARPQRALDLARGLQAIEQELRLPLTQIVAPEDPAVGVGGQIVTRVDLPRIQVREAGQRAPADGDDPTRQRGPQVIRPQGYAVRAAPESSVGDDEATRLRGPQVIAATPARADDRPERERQLPPAPEENAATRLRDQVAILDRGSTDVPGASGSQWRRGVLIGVAVLAAAAAVGVVVALQGHSSRGSAQPGGQPTAPGGSGQNALPPNYSAPDPPTVTGTVVSGGVKFSWSYGNPEPGDVFHWRNDETGKFALATTPSVTVPATGNQQVCIQVEVIRQNDGAASGLTNPVCK